MSTRTAPDYVEPVVGWRVWYVVESAAAAQLASIYHQVLWPQGRALEAQCGRARLPFFPFRRTLHEAPAERCLCGIYAGLPDGVRDYLPNSCLRPAAHPIVGRVSLWGDVVECERGWRAARAYPERLYVPRLGKPDAEAMRLAHLLEGYGVPVEVLDDQTADDDGVEEIMAAVDECTRALGATSPLAALPDSWRFWER